MTIDQQNNKQTDMSFLDHLEVLRWHIIRSISVVTIFSVVAFLNKSLIFDTIILGPKNLNFITYRMVCHLSEKIGMDKSFCIDKIPFIVSNIDMTGQFTIHIFVSVILGIVFSSPYLIWEIWRFVKPGLYKKEKNQTKAVVFWTSALFILGVMFGYFVVTPISINFLGSYQVSEEISNQITLDSYITTISMLSLICGLIFELPLGVFILSKLGLITPKFMKTYRRHSIVIILIIAGIITPPDVVSQLLISFPLFFLYEVSIFISGYVAKKKEVVV